jgi:hypothetical protein
MPTWKGIVAAELSLSKKSSLFRKLAARMNNRGSSPDYESPCASFLREQTAQPQLTPFRALQNAGYSVWRDIDDLPEGLPWCQKIEDTIRVADVVLLFLTSGAIASPNVQEEWNTAIRFQKRIIPLITRPVSVPGRSAPI